MPVKGESRKDGEGMTVDPAGFSLLNLPCAADAHETGSRFDVSAALPDGNQRTCYVFTIASFSSAALARDGLTRDHGGTPPCGV
jgi:hypothetical protein